MHVVVTFIGSEYDTLTGFNKDLLESQVKSRGRDIVWFESTVRKIKRNTVTVLSSVDANDIYIILRYFGKCSGQASVSNCGDNITVNSYYDIMFLNLQASTSFRNMVLAGLLSSDVGAHSMQSIENEIKVTQINTVERMELTT